ncbi:MAG TPA: hypothetical protein VGY91_13840 [Chthoniobacterales bacterium]|jgi:hypothetical protein|nr:hypothetical protein [Chthoniobacterales bacterium]
MTTSNVFRFSAKNERSHGVDQLRDDGSFASSDPRSLGWRIALDTIIELVEHQLLATDSAPRHLSAYRTYLGESSESLSILHFIYPLESELARIQKRLPALASAPVWEIAKRILPPAQFYKAHPKIADACRQSGSVILEATAPATITTASVNPVAGKSLAAWIRAGLSLDEGDQRSPFCFHVTIPPAQWSSITRTHFGGRT